MRHITRHPWPLYLLLALLLAWPPPVSAQEGDEGPPTPPSPEVVAPIYETRCANCHGPNGQGDGPQALQAGLDMPDLTDPQLVQTTTPARWFDIITDGVAGAAMPPFGEDSSNPLRQIDRWNLVYYLYALNTPAEQIAMGQALYERDCVECHGQEGAAVAAADFTDLAAMATVSQADLMGAIADETIDGHDPELGEVERGVLADYVRTFSYNYAPPPAAQAATGPLDPFSGGEGVVSGRVINGTPGAPPPEGLVVRLRAFDSDAEFVDAITTTVAADGAFRFEGIDVTAPVQLEPLTVYRDIPYFGDLGSAIVLSPGEPEADVTITVHETTQDPGGVYIERLHLVFDFAPGRVQVAELYILSNAGDRAYVGTVEEGTLRLTVPAEALNSQPGGDPNRYIPLADGLADTTPIPPGQSTAQSVLVYELAYEGEMTLNRPLPYDAAVVNVFVPTDGVEVSGEGIQPGGPFQAQGTTLDTYRAEGLSAGESLTLRVSGEPSVGSEAPTGPSPHRPVGPNQTQSILLGLAALIGAAAVAVLYWQGRLRLNLRPASSDRQSDLLRAIADLDDAFEAGGMEEKRYQAERARLKQDLIELMERER